jgi:hypothetical protein
MEFGLNICASAVSKHGKQTKSQNISPIDHTVIRNLELDENYKYLATEEGNDIDKSQMNEKLVNKYQSFL